MKKIPPYGKPLHALQQQGYAPKNSVNLFIGNKAWAKGENFSKRFAERTLILPPWLSPDDYQWPVKQCDVLIFDTGYADPDYIEELVYCLDQAKAKIIRSVNSDFSLTVYKE